MRRTSDLGLRHTVEVRDWLVRTALGLALVGALPAASAADASAPTVRRETVYGAAVHSARPEPSALEQRIGRPESLDELVDRLWLAAADLSGHGVHQQRPTVTRIPLADLQRMLCGGPCQVRAAYVPGEGLYLDETMRPDINAYHQSILFHELVHHVQEEAGLHADLDGCNRWRLREVEAYRLQNRFLAGMGARTHVVDPGGVACTQATAHTYREPR
jgi:hypothetical protein